MTIAKPISNVQVTPDAVAAGTPVTLTLDAQVDTIIEVQVIRGWDLAAGQNYYQVSYPSQMPIIINTTGYLEGDYWFKIKEWTTNWNLLSEVVTPNLLNIDNPPVVTITYPSEGDVLSSATIPIEGVVTNMDGDPVTDVTSVDVLIKGNSLDLVDGSFSGIAIKPKEEIEITVIAVDTIGNIGSDTVTVTKVHDMGKRSKQ